MANETISQVVYRMVGDAVKKDGITTKAAITRVAEELGRAEGAVQTAYYRQRRKHVQEKGKNTTPTTQARKPATTTTQDNPVAAFQSALHDLGVAMGNLVNAANTLIAHTERQDARFEQMRRALD